MRISKLWCASLIVALACGLMASTATAGPGAAIGKFLADIDGDGTTDVVLLQTGASGGGAIGDLYAFILDSGAIESMGLIVNVPTGFTVVGFADLDGNDTSDLIVQETATSRLVAYLLTGTTVDASFAFFEVPAGDTISGLADTNGDGNADLVLFNGATQRVSVVAFQPTPAGGPTTGLDVIAADSSIELPAGYTVAALADADGDGRVDLIIDNAGSLSAILMGGDGTSALVTGPLGALTGAFSLAGMADVDGDNLADTVFVDSTTTAGTSFYAAILSAGPEGTVAVNLTNSGGVIAVGDTDYGSVGFGNYNGDNTGDMMIEGLPGGTNPGGLVALEFTGTPGAGAPVQTVTASPVVGIPTDYSYVEDFATN